MGESKGVYYDSTLPNGASAPNITSATPPPAPPTSHRLDSPVPQIGNRNNSSLNNSANSSRNRGIWSNNNQHSGNSSGGMWSYSNTNHQNSNVGNFQAQENGNG